jgi:xylan 1,4-beta-xylosidase
MTEMSYWTFTDAFFEEGGIFNSVFQSGFGLIATGGIPKAAFNAFKILHYLGDLQMGINSDSALLTKRSSDGSMVMALWNYVEPGQQGRPKEVNIQLSNGSFAQAKISLVDDNHGSPLKLWKSMGSPAFPSMREQALLRREAELAPPFAVRLKKPYLSLSLQPNALAVIEFRSARGPKS